MVCRQANVPKGLCRVAGTFWAYTQRLRGICGLGFMIYGLGLRAHRDVQGQGFSLSQPAWQTLHPKPCV